jgi:putative transposase
VWAKHPVYFITACVAKRRPLLANDLAHVIFRDKWSGLSGRHGWAVGRYVVMPDHVHFFLRPLLDGAKPLSEIVGRWKEWTAKRILSALGESAPLRQPEFFDHVLRSEDSMSEKWVYVRENPVRAGLVAVAEDWPYAGSIDFE